METTAKESHLRTNEETLLPALSINYENRCSALSLLMKIGNDLVMEL